MSNAILQQGSPNAYRVYISNDAAGDVKVGAVVQSLLNEVTGSEVGVMVHPWLPQGCAWIRQKTLPMPNTNISETTPLATVQDFMQIAWPAIQFSYDSSISWVSALCHYAPSYSGLISGIQGVGVGTTPPSASDNQFLAVPTRASSVSASSSPVGNQALRLRATRRLALGLSAGAGCSALRPAPRSSLKFYGARALSPRRVVRSISRTVSRRTPTHGPR